MTHDKESKQVEGEDEPLTRRGFLGAVSVAATAGMFAGQNLTAQESPQVFQDSFGNIAPAAEDAISAGVLPPPIYSGGPGPSTVTPGYVQPNILMIIVDQLRSPRWLPSGGQAALDQLLPNIAFLRDHSFNFPNYFTAATNCTPARATLLTGLYAQQTSMFVTDTQALPISLQTAFPTFGTALANQADYETCWIGKWHLSDLVPRTPGDGSNGPSDYGFTAGALNLPENGNLASPNGYSNQGTDGYNNPPHGSGTHKPVRTIPNMEPPSVAELSDGAIANWFVRKWLPSAPLSKPWFAAVSFVNPHDVSYFPASFALTQPPNFAPPPVAITTGYQPPPLSGYPLSAVPPDNFLPALNTLLYPTNSKPPEKWNVLDGPEKQPYGVSSSSGWGKPGLQTYFQNVINSHDGTIETTNGWFTFLNYYFWMQACVDYQIGRVLNSLAAAPFAANTIVVFTSDHGEFGGSHNLHTKGGALYDESINVPLYISFPPMRSTSSPGSTALVRPFVCSSVDIFPFLYTVALGNSAWRNNPDDPYTYLSGREAILDAILCASPEQRRLSPFLNSNGIGFQPYILHTTDEYGSAYIPHKPSHTQPSHAIAYRTVDTTVSMTLAGAKFYGGAKLGIYSYWSCGTTTPDKTKSAQYEFYDYTAGNVGELGNTALVSPTQLDELPSQYLSAYNAIAPSELYISYSQTQAAADAAKANYLAFVDPPDSC